ncbi:ADP-ribose pyrophosphatase YjhB (NUDIX family) [Diaminobutyricimonas aerilata]|uniref:ADP-ribose pyrophosphatase YjhB (NUDIX family) n=1 Tax=Diaminobutyricimonas aerilata TaxID=1162967 RepID=A0A2M9CNK7_9MICO|nr:ADP-ribose pyrophosphatase YjhB (NUDIX family) [Diaminobutyricimonas aerilata]
MTSAELPTDGPISAARTSGLLPDRLSTRVAYENAWMRVREDLVRWPNGHESIYGVVEKPDFALILPRDRDGFWLVEQYRYTVERRVWEFPQGSWPSGHTGTAEDLARAELREETGLRAEHVEHLGRFDEAYGFTRQACDVFIATGLSHGATEREATEADMEHRWFSDAEIDELILSGRMSESASLAALLLWRMRERSARD